VGHAPTLQHTRRLNFSRKLREKSIIAKRAKFCDSLLQNLAEAKKNYELGMGNYRN
jgi:hypothetical protein